MAPKRTPTSAAPAMSQTGIRKLVADSVVAALEAQPATMANTDNTTRNIGQGETPIARKCSYKEFMSCQPFNFKGEVAYFSDIISSYGNECVKFRLIVVDGWMGRNADIKDGVSVK
ncbi:hypothetical protein Tco_1255484 [Tanacetum coccineum]